MKRYILIPAMLVFALSLSAQNTTPGRESRSSGSAVKEKKDADESRKAANPVTKSNDNRKNTEVKSRNQVSPSGTRTQTRTSSQSVVRQSPAPVDPGRTRTTTTTREREVRTERIVPQYNPGNSGNRPSGNPSYERQGPEGKANQGVRDRGASSGRQSGNEGYHGQNPSRSTNQGVRDRGTSSVRQTSTAVTRTTTTRTVTSREYIPRDEKQYVSVRKSYTVPERRVIVRSVPETRYAPRPVEYRRTYYPYHIPPRVEIIWSVNLYNTYRYIYPDYDYWYYPIGYRIHTASAYDADRYIGEFARIYGRVLEAWYSYETDEYFLYFGEPYPYQDFTVIISGRDARRFSRRPDRYFSGRHIAVTGIVSIFEGKPEMVIRKRSQVDVYH